MQLSTPPDKGGYGLPEMVAIAAGRHMRVRGMRMLLSCLFPTGLTSSRYIRGVRTRIDGLAIDVDTRELIDWEMLFTGEYEKHIGTLLRLLVHPGDVVVDVGANVGAHTLTMARLVGSGSVLAFEPNPATRNKLLRNITLNDFSRVMMFSCALGQTKMRLPLRVPRSDSAEAANTGMASLFALDTPHDLVQVEVEPFDAIHQVSQLSRLDLVKIDVQGFEEPALSGMAASLQKWHPIVIFEFEDWAWERSGSDWERVRSFLTSLGYSLFQIASDANRPLISVGKSPAPRGHMDLLAVHETDLRRQLLHIAEGAAT